MLSCCCFATALPLPLLTVGFSSVFTAPRRQIIDTDLSLVTKAVAQYVEVEPPVGTDDDADKDRPDVFTEPSAEENQVAMLKGIIKEQHGMIAEHIKHSQRSAEQSRRAAEQSKRSIELVQRAAEREAEREAQRAANETESLLCGTRGPNQRLLRTAAWLPPAARDY